MKKLREEAEIALEEYWNQQSDKGGKRRSRYTQDYVLGHKMAYHQLIENRILNIAILRNALNLPKK